MAKYYKGEKMQDIHAQHKAMLQPLRDALYNFEPNQVLAELNKVLVSDVQTHLSFPLETMKGVVNFYEGAYVWNTSNSKSIVNHHQK